MKIVNSIYETTSTFVSVNVPISNFHIERDIKQGDTVSEKYLLSSRDGNFESEN